MKEELSLLVHVDVDSPIKLLNFYQINNVNYNTETLEQFYKTAFERALNFFSDQNIKASFFVVGDELQSQSVRGTLRKAHLDGHEIENHTFSHPFGLAGLERGQRKEEIVRCNELIFQTTGRKPIGFRSPGYSINDELIDELDQLGFTYDSSGFWSIMNFVLKVSHKMLFKNGLKNEGFGQVTSKLPHMPYTPDKSDWLTPGSGRKIIELPLPRTPFFQLPFYHNFNLWSPSIYSDVVSKSIRKPCLVYLFHIIEFMDMKDNIPNELSVHPNFKVSVGQKLKRSKTIMDNLMKRYAITKTGDFCSNYNSLKGI